MVARLIAAGMILMSIFYGASTAMAGSKTGTAAEGVPTCSSCKTSLSKLKQSASKIKSKSACRTFKGEASFYGDGDGFEGKLTANEEVFRPDGLTAATHPILSFNTYVYVTNLKNGKTVKVRINDRLGKKNRLIDLSSGAARKIGLTINQGTTMVKVSTCGRVQKFKTPTANDQAS